MGPAGPKTQFSLFRSHLVRTNVTQSTNMYHTTIAFVTIKILRIYGTQLFNPNVTQTTDTCHTTIAFVTINYSTSTGTVCNHLFIWLCVIIYVHNNKNLNLVINFKNTYFKLLTFLSKNPMHLLPLFFLLYIWDIKPYI